jgi:hypothetical protein
MIHPSYLAAIFPSLQHSPKKMIIYWSYAWQLIHQGSVFGFRLEATPMMQPTTKPRPKIVQCCQLEQD